jgi:FkbH-like protein
MATYALRPVTDDDVITLLRWRNQPAVRATSLTTHVISEEEHRAWWARAKDDPSYAARILEEDGRVVGALNLYRIDRTERSGWWGFSLDSEAVDPTLLFARWLAVEEQIVNFARAEGLGTLRCETLASNERVIKLHARAGFVEERRTSVTREGRSEEVVVMALDLGAAPEHATAATRPIFVLGSANWQFLECPLREELRAASLSDFAVEPMSFGVWRTWLADPDSPLRRADRPVVLFAERFEDLRPVPSELPVGDEHAAIEERLADYALTIESARGLVGGMFFVLTLAPLASPAGRIAPIERGTRDFAHSLNDRFCERISSLPDTHLVDLNGLVRRVGVDRASPGRYWLAARAPFARPMLDALARSVIGGILALTGRTTRVVVTDLDNTLWHGVIGDDGIGGIGLGNDLPGSAHRDVQRFLAGLQERGIVLAIASKNTEGVALQAIDEHPHMVLRRGDFVAHRIHWESKVESIRSLAKELSLGLSSFLFLDDSPYEREHVRAELPDVRVPELPVDVSAWPSFLSRLPEFAFLTITEADRARHASYVARADAARIEGSFGSKEEYWRSLRMVLSMRPLGSENRERVLQLIAKTNQFNTTTLRLTQAELDSRIAAGGEVWSVALRDRYLAQEIIGVVVLAPRERAVAVDLFLLSCRVLGRDVEQGVLRWIVGRARSQGLSKVFGTIVETAKNEPCRGVFRDAGFSEVRAGEFMYATSASPARADWFTYDAPEAL